MLPQSLTDVFRQRLKAEHGPDILVFYVYPQHDIVMGFGSDAVALARICYSTIKRARDTEGVWVAYAATHFSEFSDVIFELDRPIAVVDASSLFSNMGDTL